MDVAQEIRKLVVSMLTDDQFLVDVVVSSKHGPRKVLVTIDGDQGITIDSCAEISRQLSKELDENGLIDENYMLEVSTPGLEQPLTLKRQYLKNIGRNLKVKLRDSVIEGKLSEVNADEIVLVQEIGNGKKKESKVVEIPFAEIEKTFVLVSFK
jgi:ribosome maturation factor RimP